MQTLITEQLSSLTAFVGLLLGLALLISSLGFVRMVYFISIGYAFSITAMVVAVVIGFRDHLSWIAILQNVGLLIWSLRLGVYLVQRDRKSSFQREMEQTYQRTNALPLPVKAAIWVTVSLLYVAMFAPSLFTLTSANTLVASPAVGIAVFGLIVMFGGLALEGLADKQKADFKARFPKQFCNTGFYRWVRFPNYLGEILFWVGNWIVGIPFYATLLQMIVATIGMVCIVLIMLGSTKRLEESQDKRYNSLTEYQTYVSSVPVLIPLLPIYSFKNLRVYLG